MYYVIDQPIESISEEGTDLHNFLEILKEFGGAFGKIPVIPELIENDTFILLSLVLI